MELLRQAFLVEPAEGSGKPSLGSSSTALQPSNTTDLLIDIQVSDQDQTDDFCGGQEDVEQKEDRARRGENKEETENYKEDEENGNEEEGEDSEDEDDDEEDATDLATQKKKSQMLDVSQKKRADYAAFDSWLAENRDNIAKTKKKAAEALTDEDKTSAALMREFESTKIIESPRDYQIELFEKAKRKNIIAVLDTGSGKTLVAALLLRHTIDTELGDRALEKPHRVSFFLVDKVALVFQQHAVLACNLSQSVARFSGDKSDLRWSSKEFWDATFEANMVIVCTADILLKCFHHSYIRMDQINLLIFDEAHHTKKNHPYARIMKDFYAPQAQTNPRSLPKIFGMTASPADARVNVTQAAQELEALLHSEIATVVQDPLLRAIVNPKKERVVHYHTALRAEPTLLTEQLQQLVGRYKVFAKNFCFAQENLPMLGPWLIDRFWQIIFRSDELAKQEARVDVEGSLDTDSGGTYGGFLDAQVDAGNNGLNPELFGDLSLQTSANAAAVREANRVVQEHRFVPPTMALLSNKVRRLYETLLDEYTKSSGARTRCIVFVEQRYTALLLADLLQQEKMKVPNLRSGVLTGGGSTDMGNNSFRTQLLTIAKFKQGRINCLFATSIAEEGLDIPDCNLVIRFDLYHTMIQYIQSRGRARHQESVYIHMAELGNLNHSRQLAENKTSEDKMRDFCNALPDDRKLQGNDYDMDYFLREDVGQPFFEVPSTKAKLTYRASLVILAQYVSTLPEPSEGSLRAEYSVFHTNHGFVCEVALPSSSPIRHATGRPHRRKQIAKCAAAFVMCLRLYEKKYIDKHLKPVFSSKLPAMRNARLAISSKKQATYPMRAKPTMWYELGTPSQLFATVLRLSNPEAMFHSSRPLVLLTRKPMPRLCQFPLYFGKGRVSLVDCVPLDVPMTPTDAELHALTTYTLCAFEDVFSKEYEGTAADLPYYIAPCIEKQHGFCVGESRNTAHSMLDWNSIQYVVDKRAGIPCHGNEPDDFFTNRFLADAFDGSRKFYMRRVRRDLKPFDPVPEGVPPPKHNVWKRPTTTRNIINYSVSVTSKWRSEMVLRGDQPVVEAEIVVQRRNLLDDRVSLDDPKSQICFLALGTLRISPLSIDAVAMIYNFPPIIHRLESTLIALEAAHQLGLSSLRPSLALEAVTKDCDNTDANPENNETAVNFQAGMGKNYERLELLGDSFLKMASTIALYTLSPDKDEFEYHVQRMCMICNRNLFNNALDVKLEEYIRSKEFDRSWYPPTVEAADKPAASSTTAAAPQEKLSVSALPPQNDRAAATFGLVLKKGKRQKPPGNHALADKSIADVCEAMIGAAYLTTYDDNDFDLAVQAVSAVVKSKFHPMRSYREYFAAYKPPEWQTAPATAAQIHLAQAVARDVGYTFRYPRLLRCAVMHPSYPRIYESLPSYQRLEFLGDALFDMAAVDYLFQRFPDKDPQWLTEHKMAMVSNQFLSALSVTLGFHKHLLSFSSDLQKQVLEYVVQIEDARARAEAEAVRAGRSPTEFARDYWVNVTRPVKALADVLEAYVGALFVDAGYDYHGAVLPFFRRHVLPYFADMAAYDTFANKHPVTLAVHLLGQRFGCRDWRAVVQETPQTEGDGCVTFATQVAAGFLVHGHVVGSGVAESGRYAKVAAAKQALAQLDSLCVEAFRALTGCNCPTEADADVDADVDAGSGRGASSTPHVSLRATHADANAAAAVTANGEMASTAV
ncbi:Ribonuclease III [Niveomyces insectorum RCEF 264]|uniref:Dicer-like protein 1 n=1 Tax=Niveomyces insectorum RCEF 264 TaxID=1081102 RepID=A0A162J1U2_9HYPO|nr:Ribonuclease III [Niveomyces insectorum RCEF 264]